MALHRIASGDLTLNVRVEGDGPLIVLVHGWPETSWSWRHQIPALVRAGYRTAALDVRGFGDSDCPTDVSAYEMQHLTRDVIAVIDALGAKTATLIGHDWGAPIVWNTALSYPERIERVVGMSVPYLGRQGNLPPTEMFRQIYTNRFFYVVYFQEPGLAEAEFSADVRDALAKIYVMSSADSTPAIRAAMRTRTTGYLDGIELDIPLPAWLQADLDEYVRAFETSGFHGGIHRYRCMDADWHAWPHAEAAQITQPAYFLAGEHDSVLRYAPGVNLMDLMDPFYADLRSKRVIPGAGHWVQQEQPQLVNAALLEFLGTATA